MFESLRDAFREAVQNFKDELNRDEVPRTVHGTVDRLLLGMQNEIREAKARLRTLHAQAEEARAEAGRESEEESTCRRREELARRVGDEETARIAAEYAVRHARRRDVLERKAAALREEHALRAGELAEMMARLREAQEKRDTLAAAQDPPAATHAAGELFEELDRMASAIGEDEPVARRRTMDDLERQIRREYADLRVDPWSEVERPPVDYEARLAELKRRMGKE